jgi:hypothetical protein
MIPHHLSGERPVPPTLRINRTRRCPLAAIFTVYEALRNPVYLPLARPIVPCNRALLVHFLHKENSNTRAILQMHDSTGPEHGVIYSLDALLPTTFLFSLPGSSIMVQIKSRLHSRMQAQALSLDCTWTRPLTAESQRSAGDSCLSAGRRCMSPVE